jgi:hypothetical protein
VRVVPVARCLFQLLMCVSLVVSPVAASIVPAQSACRSDCPMHVKRLRCHDASPQGHHERAHCQRGPALRGVACHCGVPHPSIATPGHEMLLAAQPAAGLRVVTRLGPPAEPLEPPSVILDPPLRPPAFGPRGRR